MLKRGFMVAGMALLAACSSTIEGPQDVTPRAVALCGSWENVEANELPYGGVPGSFAPMCKDAVAKQRAAR